MNIFGAQTEKQTGVFLISGQKLITLRYIDTKVDWNILLCKTPKNYLFLVSKLRFLYIQYTEWAYLNGAMNRRPSDHVPLARHIDQERHLVANQTIREGKLGE